MRDINREILLILQEVHKKLASLDKMINNHNLMPIWPLLTQGALSLESEWSVGVKASILKALPKQQFSLIMRNIVV